jgi:hypothetical protein
MCVRPTLIRSVEIAVALGHAFVQRLQLVTLKRPRARPSALGRTANRRDTR